MRVTLLLTLLLVALCRGEEAMLAPTFTVEPPSLVQYWARAGVSVTCAARAHPPPHVSWLAADGTALHTDAHRRVYDNGTLEILPSSAYEPAATTVRCRAANLHGVTLSRDVTLQPVSEAAWEVSMVAAAATAGGVAALTCDVTAPPPHHQLVRTALWYRGDRLLHIDPPAPESRYLLAGNSLLIADVRAEDAGAYSCAARHQLSGDTKRARAVLLTVTPSAAGGARVPQLVAAGGVVHAAAGSLVCLPCVASDHPAPQYTWYREYEGRLQPVEASAESWWWRGGAALCVRASAGAAGGWGCRARGAAGDVSARAALSVRGALTVAVAPSRLTAAPGSTVRLRCAASDARAALHWEHDGAAAGTGAALTLRGVSRAHRGVYQCVARRDTDSAQAAVELRLAESPPELHYTFIEQALRPGGAVSLRCAASAAPPPRFSWLLDDQPIEHFTPHHRYSISEESSVNGDVVSVLNISAVTAADGGRYSCRAHNPLGHAQHSARLNIYGPPSVRALGPLRLVAGDNATVLCPYAGYPISSISWWRRGASVALGGVGRVSARGAELRLRPALPLDAGHYACAVAAPAPAPSARRDIEIQVRNPPKISPFMFSSELTEGSSAQVLCGVSSGDKPMYFSWLKDGAPLPANLQIEEKSLNEFSLLMFSDLRAQHSGEYTCRVSNHAAAVNYTAALSVKVAPAWSAEPADAAVLLGAPLSLPCAATGHPAPAIAWYRRVGESASLGGESGEQWERVGAGEWGGAGVAGGAHVANGSLVAGAAARATQGHYRCVADNGVGTPLLKHVNLTVHEPAHFEGSGGNVSCVRGQSAALTCEARGDAPLHVTWSHRGARLDLASYRWAVTEVRAPAGLRSTLQLRAAERDDAGEYRCHAHNHYGRSEQLMYLHVEEPPEAPRRLRLRGVGARWVRLEWGAAGGGAGREGGLTYAAHCTALHALPGAGARSAAHNLTLLQHHDRIDPDGLRILSAKLEGLRPAAAYSLRLTAANHVGLSPHSEPLMFTTLEEVPTASPQNVRVRAADPGELHVSWSAPPQDSWNGELLGYVCTWHEVEVAEGGSGGGGRGVRGVAGCAVAPGWSSAALSVGGLRAGARLALSVRAYNRAGAGPHSPTLYATTADGVPEQAPRALSCSALSARSVRVRWAPPPPAAAAAALTGYDLHYAPLYYPDSWSSARAGLSGAATLQGLRAAANYSVWVRARSPAGPGPPAPPLYCRTADDVPEAVEQVRALAAGAGTVRVSWLAPRGRITHYTLYTRELGKVGGEWAQRVEVAAEGAEGSEGVLRRELCREVGGLRSHTAYEFWVRGASAAGAGAHSRLVSAAPKPAHTLSARMSSFGGAVSAALGSRVRLRCAAVGAPPLRWRWAPLPSAHTLTDDGDLIIHKVEASSAGNYTCGVRNALGGDVLSVTLSVLAPPAPPAPRLRAAALHALHLAWDVPSDGGAHILGYTVWWSIAAGAAGAAGVAQHEQHVLHVTGADTSAWVWRLSCGALYRVTLQAHNALGASPHSPPLLTRTKGDKAKPPPGKEFVWANSTTLRLNLLTWGGRCPVDAWTLAVRSAAAGAWQHLLTDGETAEANNLRPGTWYEFRVVAHSAAGDVTAFYKAATHTLNGEHVGEAVEVPSAVRSVSSAESGGAGSGAGVPVGAGGGGGPAAALWRGGLAPALLAAAAAGLAALLAVLAGLVLARRRGGDAARAWCVRRECSPQPPLPHPQLYTTEPTKRNGKSLTPLDVAGDLHEISPYATFSMSGGTDGTRSGDGASGTAAGVHGVHGAQGVQGAQGGQGVQGAQGAGCALHLHTFVRAESLDLAAPPPRPNLLAHTSEYGGARDSDSESSGSPCAACAAELYRLPAAAAHRSDTLPAVESSAEDTVYGGAAAVAERTRGKHAARARRRREHSRPAAAVPTARYPL